MKFLSKRHADRTKGDIMSEWDAVEFSILNWMQATVRSPVLDEIMVTASRLGNVGAVWIAIAVVLVVIPRYRKAGILCGIALFFSLLITNIAVKNIVARPRPFTMVDVKLLIPQPGEYSFPSGHASSSFAAAFVLWRERLRVSRVPVYWITMALAIIVALSRVYLYVHFPTDILAGAAAGALSSWLAYVVYHGITGRLSPDGSSGSGGSGGPGSSGGGTVS